MVIIIIVVVVVVVTNRFGCSVCVKYILLYRRRGRKSYTIYAFCGLHSIAAAVRGAFRAFV